MDKREDLVVGVFVLAALGVLVAASLWIAGSSLFGTGRVGYTVLMDASGGIRSGDRVRVAGVSVGRVRSIALDPAAEPPVRIEVGLRPHVRLHGDSTARIATAGLIGASYLEIDAGTPGLPLLGAGSEIHGRPAPGLEQALDRVDEVAGRVVAVLDQTSRILDELAREIVPLVDRAESLLSEENARDVRAILGALRETTGQTGPRLNALLERLEGVATRAEHGLEEVPLLAQRMLALVDDTRAALGPGGERLGQLLEATERGLGSAEGALAVVGDNREQLEATIGDLRATAANLRDFSRQVKERPYRLLRVKDERDRRPGERRRGSRP